MKSVGHSMFRNLVFSTLLVANLGFVGVTNLAFAQNKKPEEPVSKIAKISDESELIAILADSSAPEADKALACKRLAVFGSAKAVPELSKLLSNEHLASWSRIALEAIPEQASKDALREASKSLSGNLLIGVINSLGVLRDSQAVELLVARLGDSDVEVAMAAAAALGKIGGDQASSELRKLLANASADLRNAGAEACVLCAEKYWRANQTAEAIALYDDVKKAEVPTQRVVEATRGAILARGDAGIPLLVEQLRSKDRQLFAVGLSTARELPSKAVVDALVAEVGTSAPDRAALIVQAMADRPSTLELATIVKMASAGPREVRIAAMRALSRVGDATSVEALCNFALEKGADLWLPAKGALAEISADGVNEAILSKLPKATGDLQQFLIEVIGQRRIEATQELVKALSSSSPAIRKVALESLGSTIPQSQLSILIDQLVKASSDEQAEEAQRALTTAAVRMPDREACAAELDAAMKANSLKIKTSLLKVLGAVGGESALKAIGQAAKEGEPALRDASTQILGDWLTDDVAPVLLDIATSGPDDKYQVRAMRGYIRIARQFVLPDKKRIEMYNTAMEAAKQTAEQKLIAESLPRHPSLGTLKLAIKSINNPAIKDEATLAAKEIAAKLGDKPEVQELMTNAGLNP
jgi:HEAT repeat protein